MSTTEKVGCVKCGRRPDEPMNFRKHCQGFGCTFPDAYVPAKEQTAYFAVERCNAPIMRASTPAETQYRGEQTWTSDRCGNELPCAEHPAEEQTMGEEDAAEDAFRQLVGDFGHMASVRLACVSVLRREFGKISRPAADLSAVTEEMLTAITDEDGFAGYPTDNGSRGQILAILQKHFGGGR